MGDAMSAVCDGRGADRVADTVLATLAREETRVRLRRAAPADSRAIWTWRNHPETRAQSLTTDPIPWADHDAWYPCAPSDPRRHLLALEDRAGPRGMIRFDVSYQFQLKTRLYI